MAVFSSYGKHDLLLTSLRPCDCSGHIFGASAGPRSLAKKIAVSPSSTVHSGQHDAKYVTSELLLHATFVADEIWSEMIEPARTHNTATSVALLCVQQH